MEKVSRTIELRITDIKKRIKRNYLKGDRTTVLLLGKPGIGKTEITKQIAEELASEQSKDFVEFKLTWTANGEIDYTNIYNKAVEVLKNPEKYFVYIMLRLSEREPTDFVGYPRSFELNYNGKTVKLSDYNPFVWQLVASACAGILVLDDFTNIFRPDVESVSYQITLDRMTGWIKFNKDLLVIATGNRPEYSGIAKMLATPLISRMKVYNVKEGTVDDWIKYMNKKYEVWDKRIAGFLKNHTDMFIKVPEEAEILDPYPTPRSWTNLAKVTYDIEEPEDLYIEALATVGNEAATLLKSFISVKVPEVIEVAAKPEIWNELKFEEKILLSMHIASYIENNIDNKNTIIRLSKLFKYLSENARDELVFIFFTLNEETQDKLLDYAIEYEEINSIEKMLLELLGVKE